MTATEMFFQKHIRRFDAIDESCLEDKDKEPQEEPIPFNATVKFGVKIVKFEEEYLMHYYAQMGVLKYVDDSIVEKMLQLERVTTEGVQRILREELRTQF